MFAKVITGIACVIAVMALPGEATAQNRDRDRALELAATQMAVTHQMANDALLVALDVDAQQSLASLQRLRVRFDRVIKGLRYGDDLLGLDRPSDPALLAELESAEELWRLMDTEIQAGLANTGFPPDQLDRIIDVSAQLQDTMNSAMAIVADDRVNGQLFSMLLIAIEESERKRVLLEQMTKELLLIAYGRDVEVNRVLLRQTAGEFGSTLAGLINGDLDRLLLPAPTDAIRSELTELERLWRDDLEPIVEMAIDGDTVDTDTVRRVVEINARLSVRSNEIITLYQQL